MKDPSVAVIGGGINGAGIAWELVRRGYRTTLFDKGQFGAQTSAATTKLVHGGLRYLEQGRLGLVRESLRERAFLLERVPDLVRRLELVLPIYADSIRPRWRIGLGLRLYDGLAGRRGIAPHRWRPASQLANVAGLRLAGLQGAFSFFDAQVDDRGLVRRVVAAAARDGLTLREQSPVEALDRPAALNRPEALDQGDRDGGGWRLRSGAEETRFDAVVNATGPWLNEFVRATGISASYSLALVRGSHLLLPRQVSESGFVLQAPRDARIFFVLPWRGQTLVGTTEVAHAGSMDDVRPAPEEIDYLLEAFNHYFTPAATTEEIAGRFAGVRPLIVGRGGWGRWAGSGAGFGRMTRESKIEVRDRLIHVYGGKLTTFMALARRVGDRLDGVFGVRRQARTPLF